MTFHPNAISFSYVQSFEPSAVIIMEVVTDLVLNPSDPRYDAKAVGDVYKAAGKHAMANAQHVARFLIRSNLKNQ